MLIIILAVMATVLIAIGVFAYASRRNGERRSTAGAASDELQQERLRRRASGQMPSR